MKNFIFWMDYIPFLRNKLSEWRKTYDYKFEFLFWKEVWNTFGHILFSVAFTHVLVPYLALIPILILLFLIGFSREIWQNVRGKYQPFWISMVDSISFPVGGLIWWLIIATYNINIDFL